MPLAELDARFSSPGATPTAWEDARDLLHTSEVYWLTTVRADGRPHVTPLLAAWLDGAVYFCTGPHEQKARNLAGNAHCAVTTGRNTFSEGLDVVVEGDAVQVTDDARLRRIAGVYESKYGPDWHFDVRDGVFVNRAGGEAVVYEVSPLTVFGFRKGAVFSQTRWRFPR